MRQFWMRSSAGFLPLILLTRAPFVLPLAFVLVPANPRWQRSHLDWMQSGLFVRSPNRSRGGLCSIRAAVPIIVVWQSVCLAPPVVGPSPPGRTPWYRMLRLGQSPTLSFAPAVGPHCSPRQSPLVFCMFWRSNLPPLRRALQRRHHDKKWDQFPAGKLRLWVRRVLG